MSTGFISLWYSGIRLSRCKQGETEQLQMFYNEYVRIPTLQEDGEITRVPTSILIKFFKGDNNAWCKKTEMGCSQP